MSRRLWRCRNPTCPAPLGAVLGRLTSDEGLVLNPTVVAFKCYLDTRRATISCPARGAEREWRRGPVYSRPGASGIREQRSAQYRGD